MVHHKHKRKYSKRKIKRVSKRRVSKRRNSKRRVSKKSRRRGYKRTKKHSKKRLKGGAAASAEGVPEKFEAVLECRLPDFPHIQMFLERDVELDTARKTLIIRVSSLSLNAFTAISPSDKVELRHLQIQGSHISKVRRRDLFKIEPSSVVVPKYWNRRNHTLKIKAEVIIEHISGRLRGSEQRKRAQNYFIDFGTKDRLDKWRDKLLEMGAVEQDSEPDVELASESVEQGQEPEPEPEPE